MPILPTRSRSLRKPVNHVAIASSDSVVASAVKTTSGESISERKNDLSPSRLPIKPIQNSTENSLQPRPLRSHVSTVTKATTATTSTTAPNNFLPELRRSTSIRRAKTSSVALDPVKKDRFRPPVTTASRNLRQTSSNSSSVRTRDVSQTRERSSTLTSGSYSRLTTRGSVTAGDVAERTATYVSEGHSLKKPAFSTHQQHYSPAKNLAPKLHPAAFLAPPTPSKWPSNKVISAETAKLQNELLQLHLLHRDSECIEREWRASAKRKLEGRFQDIVKMEHDLLRLERNETSKLNSTALKKWQEVGVPGWGLEEKIHIFDDILTGLMSTGETGGRYAGVIRRFERWIEISEDVLDHRKKKDETYSELLLIEELDSTWKDDCFYLGRKLDVWKEKIGDLGIPQCESSLELVMDHVQKMILGMLEELDFMINLEETVMKREAYWIKQMNDEMDATKYDEPVAGAIWRSIGVMKNR